MNILKKAPLLFLLIPLLTCCNIIPINNGSDTDSGSGDGGDNNPPIINPTGDYSILEPNYDQPIRTSKSEVTYEDLFNLNNKVDIRIDVDKSELQKIHNDNVYGGDFDSIKPETYHLAKKVTITLVNKDNTFTWEYENVGIRQKGNTSRRPIIKDNGEVSNKNHFKLSFDETFTDTEKYDSSFISQYGNEDYEDRDFLGLTGLDIKWNKTDDRTHLKEIYASMMFRSAGVIHQQIGLSTMKMHYDDDKVADFGLCYIYEPSNKSIIKRTLSSAKKYIGMPTWKEESNGQYGVSGKKYGDLYKATYGKGNGASSGADFTKDSIKGSRLGVKTDIKGYNWPTYERKTNKNESYDDGLMKDLVNNVLNSSSSTYEQIDALVNLSSLAMEEAVMYYLGDPDCMRYNYNNYMVYFSRVDKKMTIIPMDNDRAFGIGTSWRDGLDYVLSNNASAMNPNSLNNNSQRNQLLKKTIFTTGTKAQADYKHCLALVKNSNWLKEETFENYYNILKSTYSGLATFSLNSHDDNLSFKEYLNKKLAI